MNKLIQKPKNIQKPKEANKFERFNLLDNPFPSSPTLNADADDKRINGHIFEMAIRIKEYNQIEKVFLKKAQTDNNHLRLGYLMDTSYIGRGNGKSAFIVNIMNSINNEYCLDISENINKCFSLRIVPEAGGRTKTYNSFIDLFFSELYKSDIIATTLAAIRYEILLEINPDVLSSIVNENDLVKTLNDERWYKDNKVDIKKLNQLTLNNQFIQYTSDSFPLRSNHNNLFYFDDLVFSKDFLEYYTNLKRPKERIDFIFNDLVLFFEAAGFNGAYLFVDDFERIPDFQSAQLKKDFARELRSCLFDGPYQNTRVGFYNLFLVIHAGVPRLIEEAWGESGIEARIPLNPKLRNEHIIKFEKLNKSHALLLIKKYLDEYHINNQNNSNIYFPFTEDAIAKIGEMSEYNATNILLNAYTLLNIAADDNDCCILDEKFILSQQISESNSLDKDTPKKETAPLDLMEKAKK